MPHAGARRIPEDATHGPKKTAHGPFRGDVRVRGVRGLRATPRHTEQATTQQQNTAHAPHAHYVAKHCTYRANMQHYRRMQLRASHASMRLTQSCCIGWPVMCAARAGDRERALFLCTFVCTSGIMRFAGGACRSLQLHGLHADHPRQIPKLFGRYLFTLTAAASPPISGRALPQAQSARGRRRRRRPVDRSGS